MSQASLVERIWAHDASVWTGSGEDRWLGWLDVHTRVRQHADELRAFADAARRAVRRRRPPRHGRLLARARGAAAHLRRRVASTCSTRRTRPRSAALEDEPRPGAHALPRLLQVGLHDRDALAPRVLLGADGRPRRAVRRDHRPRLGARAAGERARLPRDVRRRAESAAATRRSRCSASCRRRCWASTSSASSTPPRRRPTRAAREDGNPGLELGLRLGEGWQAGRDKVCLDATRTGFGLWAEQLLAESTGKQGKGLVPAPGEAADGADRQRGEVAGRRPVRARRGVLPLGVRDRGRGPRARDQPVRPAGRAGGEGQDERGARGGRAGRSSRRRSLDELLAQAGEGDYVCIQAFVDPAREARARAARRRARARRAASSRAASARATCTRPASCTRAGPNTGLFVQVVDETGEELPIPGREFGFGRLIRSQAAGDFAALEERGRRVIRTPIGGRLMQLGMVGLGRMGSGMTKRLAQHGHESRRTTRTSSRRRRRCGRSRSSSTRRATSG